MISELSKLIIILEKFNACAHNKIVTQQEIKEANDNIIELHQDLELLAETITESLDSDTYIPKIFTHLNKNFVRVISAVEDMQNLVGFAVNRCSASKKMKLKS